MSGFDSARRTTPVRARQGEPGRWLSAVLIVVAIGATTVAVRVWPARMTPGAQATTGLASRPLRIIVDAPRTPAPALVSRSLHPPARQRDLSQPVAAAPLMAEVAVEELPGMEPAAIAEPSGDAAGVAPLEPLLPSRRVALVATPPAVAEYQPAGASPEPPLGLVDLPAVAVTRAVAVAGRGLKTGLRATTAVFKAAF